MILHEGKWRTIGETGTMAASRPNRLCTSHIVAHTLSLEEILSKFKEQLPRLHTLTSLGERPSAPQLAFHELPRYTLAWETGRSLALLDYNCPDRRVISAHEERFIFPIGFCIVVLICFDGCCLHVHEKSTTVVVQ